MTSPTSSDLPTAPKPKRRTGRIVASIVVTVLFGLLAAWLLDVEAVISGLARFDLSVLPAVMALALGILLLRWVRLAAGMWCPPSVDLLRATSLHGAALAVLPGKIGELILPLALNRLTGASMAEALGLLFVIRVYDLLTLVVFGAVALALEAELFGLAAMQPLAWLAAAGAFVVMVLLPVLARLAMRMLARPLGWSAKVGDIVQRLSAGMTSLSAGQIAALILVSSSIWCLIYAMFYITAAATQAPVDVPTAMLGGTAASLAFALPVNGVANLGPFEAAWAAAVAPAGIDVEAAAATALAAHAVMIVANLASGAIAMLIPGATFTRPAPTAD